MIERITGSLFLLFFTLAFANAQTDRQKWVDSVFNQLSEEEKISQLLIVPVSSHVEENKVDNLERTLQSVGGIFFTSGHPLKQARLTNRFQSAARVPMLIALDASHGVGKSLDSALIFPEPLALGAIDSDSVIFEMSREIGRQLKLLGVNLNIGPSANFIDQNEWTYRTDLFGDDRLAVTRKLLAHMRGLESHGILTCTKHFPIQGITVTDIQKGVPQVKAFADSVQLYPFKQLINNGVELIMPSTHKLPLFYEKKKAARKNKMSSAMLSTFYAGEWMRTQMNFDGLVVVDIRTIEEVSGKKNADAELWAFRTGNELIITDNNPGTIVRRIKKLLRKEKQYYEVLNRSVKKILAVKYDAGLREKRMLNTDNLLLNINKPAAKVLQHTLYRSAITVTKNQTNALPITTLENRKFATVMAGDTTGLHRFQRMVSKYIPYRKFYFEKPDSVNIHSILKKFDVIIIPVTSATSEEILKDFALQMKAQNQDQQIILADFGCPHLSKYADQFQNIVTGYTRQPLMTTWLPQSIFGAIGTQGKLPLAMGDIRSGKTVSTPSLGRLSYSIPEDAGISSKTLKKIESITREAIEIKGTPGGIVFVAKDGKVIYEKPFGYLTYENQTPVTDSTIYDLASVTKISATLQAVMFLYDRGLIDINKKASVYLPELKNSNKKDVVLKDVLTHQAGLWPFFPFYAQTMKESQYLPGYYVDKPTLEYPLMVADKLFTYRAMPDTLWSWSLKGKNREKPARTPYDYKYSDLSFYILHHLSEKILNQPIDDFVSQNLFEPLGSFTTGYLPLMHFSTNRIAPTENDKSFRKALLIGTVHDQGAAMHGGVAGHAGVFSTANDLGKLGQMLLQEGYYGGYQYYKPETVRAFSQRPYQSNHRGLGWAKPLLSDPNSPTSLYASDKTFGHTGYTGTCIWIDPEFNLVYIFLSNRVHPDVSTKLLTANIRSRIQDVIYESIFEYCKGSVESQPPVKSTFDSVGR